MMPGVNWGIYKTAGTEGTEVSSTYEGRHITCTAAELITDGGSGVAVKGHACIFGLVGLQAVGVCFNSGTLTDLIAIDTEGIWNLPVTGKDDAGNRALVPGEPVFINNTTCEISGVRNNATQVPFGYLLTEAATTVETISAVKVHWDPRAHWLMDDEMLYFGDDRDISIEWDQTNLEILPLTDDTGSILIGSATHHVNSVQIFGITDASYLQYITAIGQFNHFNTTVGADAQAEQHEFTQATPTMPDGMGVIENQLTVAGVAVGPFTTLESNWINIGGAGAGAGYLGIRNDGIWSGGDISGFHVYMQKYSYLPDSDALWVSIWELNYAGADSEIDAIFNVNDPALALGYAAGSVSTVIGSIPFFSTAHGALRGWIAIYDAEFA